MAILNLIGFNEYQEVDAMTSTYFHIENAHYEGLSEFCVENQAFNIIPNDVNQNIIINVINDGEVLQRFDFTHEEFDHILINLNAESKELTIRSILSDYSYIK